MMPRALPGLAIAAIVACIAWRARALSPGGAVAAAILGALAIAAGWSWGALLVLYFAASSALSRLGQEYKEIQTGAIVAKGGARDMVQVLANGAMFGAAALAMLVEPGARWIALGAGSLAASAADTWATEIGTLLTREPRSILTWRRVPVGTSGGVSAAGSLALLAGAAFIALATRALGWTPAIAASVAVGGVAGGVVDSLLGATVQSRRWCDICNHETERSTHGCGAITHVRSGLAWMDNDMVNFLSVAAGGVIAALLTR